MALVIGILYYGIGQDEAYTSINFKLLFFTQTFLIFSSFYTALVTCKILFMNFLIPLEINKLFFTVPSELKILRREYANGWYNIYSYYFTNRLADLPVQVTASSIYVIIIYFLTGQPLEFQRIRLFLISCVLVSLVAQTFGVIIGVSFNSHVSNDFCNSSRFHVEYNT